MRRGFTLIELLVVVTIIVVLLALLTPALDKAIYQAEMLKCASNQKTSSTGMIVYATNYNRYYPRREAVHAAQAPRFYQPRDLTLPFSRWQTSNFQGYDDRPVYKPFFDLNALVDPLAGEIEIDNQESYDGSTYIKLSYQIWAGWKYINAEGNMLKLGRRMEYDYTNHFNQRNQGKSTFTVLVGDLNWFPFPNWRSAHPDTVGKISQVILQDDQTTEAQQNLTAADPDRKTTRAEWIGNLWTQGGNTNTDYNFAHDDGSVRRYKNTSWNVPIADPRLGRLPSYLDTNTNQQLDFMGVARQ